MSDLDFDVLTPSQTARAVETMPSSLLAVLVGVGVFALIFAATNLAVRQTIAEQKKQ